MSRLAFALLLALTAVAAPPTTIYRDTYGVPHIYAKTDAGAVFGLMYAQAEDNFRQLETDLIRAVGRSAEIEGERGLASDILVRAGNPIRPVPESHQTPVASWPI